MRVVSLFSGVGGLDMGLAAAGHELVAHCEIDPVCRKVLAHHWPDVPIWEDVTDVRACACDVGLPQHELRDDGGLRPSSGDESIPTSSPVRCPECGGIRGRVDLVAGGSPCQDLSVAGRRAGLDGARSGLFWHQCRVAAELAADWVVWENVAGALNSNDGADFASVLWGLTGALPDVPDGGWRDQGVVVGPGRTAVWRLLDAQWFGVAQRRRRVFVVAGPRALCGPEILFESDSSPRGARPSRSTGSVASALTRNGVGGGGGPDDNAGQANHLVPDVAGALGAVRHGPRNDLDSHGAYVVEPGSDEHVPDVTGTVTANWNKGAGNTQVDEGILVSPSEPVAFQSTFSNQATPKEDGSTPAVMPHDPLAIADARPVARRGRSEGAEWEIGDEDTYNALRAGDGGSSRQNAVIYDVEEAGEPTVFGWQENHHAGRTVTDGTVDPLTTSKTQAVAFSENQRGELLEDDVVRSMSVGGGKPGQGYPAVREDTVVRRLTPRECERLMGWPDDHTRWGIDGEITDGHRYRMCGNGVVSPVAEWIGRRLP